MNEWTFTALLFSVPTVCPTVSSEKHNRSLQYALITPTESTNPNRSDPRLDFQEGALRNELICRARVLSKSNYCTVKTH